MMTQKKLYLRSLIMIPIMKTYLIMKKIMMNLMKNLLKAKKEF